MRPSEHRERSVHPDADGGCASPGRRAFLRASLLATGALALAFPVPTPARHRSSGSRRARSISVWLKVAPDGRLVFANPQAEMGQGIWSSLAMAFADEFGADWGRVEIEAAGFSPEFRLNPGVREMFTAGSASVATALLPVRRAAAAAREVFLQAGAERMGVPVQQLRLEDSRIVGPSGSVGIGELVDRVPSLTPPREVRLKADGELRLIGRGAAAKEIPSKVSGAAVYGIDFRLPEMLYATVKASPVHGARIIGSNADAIRRMPGVVEVVPVPGGMAVVAKDTWRAMQARDALQLDIDAGDAVRVDDAWFEDAHSRALARSDGVVGYDVGDARARIATSSEVHEATYAVPWLAHATMEPMSCTARVTRGGVDLWLGTQGLEYAAREVSRATGVPFERVRVHNLMLGGGFGRRYECDVPVQAAIIAQALPGRAVKLVWTRDEDMRQDFYRPGGKGLLRATLAADGAPEALLVRVAAPAIAAHNPAFAQYSAPMDITAIDGFANLHYEVPARRFEWVRTESHVRIGWWRSVGNSVNAFYKECFLDELAERTGADPLEYRLRLLRGEAHAPTRRLLERLRDAAGWGHPAAGCVQGLALHETFGTMVGQVVEAEVTDGQVRIHRITCAYDCGSIVNPSAADAQIRGSIVWALTAAMFGEIGFERGAVIQRNFDDYPLLRIHQMPEIVAFPVLRGGAASGLGEPGVPPLAPALANAVSRATRRRIRELPLSRAGLRLAESAG